MTEADKKQFKMKRGQLLRAVKNAAGSAAINPFYAIDDMVYDTFDQRLGIVQGAISPEEAEKARAEGKTEANRIKCNV